MDRWAWSHLETWIELRQELPVGRLFCVLRGPRSAARARWDPRPTPPRRARRRCTPAVRAAPAAARARGRDVTRGNSLIVIQRQLGHAHLAITSRYLRGIDNTEIIQAVYQRHEPMIPPDGNSPQAVETRPRKHRP